MDSKILLEILRISNTKYKHVLEAKKNELELNHKLMLQDEFYPSIHLTGYTGLVADPGAMIKKNDSVCLYYLWSPFHWIHGLKHWCLVTTEDYINYVQRGVHLMPDIEQDQYGVYSGGAINIKRSNSKTYSSEIYFTANVKKLGWNDEMRQSWIGRVYLNDDLTTTTKKELLWTFDKKKYTPHFRDPKPILINDELFFLVGAQTKNKKGNVCVYKETRNSYKWVGDLKFENKLECGFMLERPEFMHIDGKDILICSPEGVEIVAGSERITTYTIGKLDSKFCLRNNTPFIPLDYGHDFYVPSIIKLEKGKYLSWGWFGISRVECHPTWVHNWSHAMTLPRVIELKNNKLIQNPHPNLQILRREKLTCIEKNNSSIINISNDSAYEHIFENTANKSFSIVLRNNSNHSVNIAYDNSGTFVLDRKQMSINYYPELGTARCVENIKVSKVHIFIDSSFLEIYLNDGEFVFSSRIFITNMRHLVFSNVVHKESFVLNDINVEWKDLLGNYKKSKKELLKKLPFKLPYQH